MNRPILVAAVLTALCLSACVQPADEPTVVTVPGPTVAVPGPAGPQGQPGVQGNQGNTGDTGKTGDGTTQVLVVPVETPPPAPDPQQ